MPVVVFSAISILLPFLIYIIAMKQFIFPFIALLIMSGAMVYFHRWAMRNFNGITGDLAGAFIEGMEVFLWLVVLVLL